MCIHIYIYIYINRTLSEYRRGADLPGAALPAASNLFEEPSKRPVGKNKSLLGFDRAASASFATTASTETQNGTIMCVYIYIYIYVHTHIYTNNNNTYYI